MIVSGPWDIECPVTPLTQKDDGLCWFFCLLMVKSAHGLNRTIKTYQNHYPKGLPEKEMGEFCGDEGMTPVKRLAGQDLSLADLYRIMSKYGPLWAAGSFQEGIFGSAEVEVSNLGHVIVIYGIKGDRLQIVDPGGDPPKREESLEWFNGNLNKSPYALLFCEMGK